MTDRQQGNRQGQSESGQGREHENKPGAPVTNPKSNPVQSPVQSPTQRDDAPEGKRPENPSQRPNREQNPMPEQEGGRQGADESESSNPPAKSTPNTDAEIDRERKRLPR